MGQDPWLTCNILDRDSHDEFAVSLANKGLIKFHSYPDSKSIVIDGFDAENNTAFTIETDSVISANSFLIGFNFQTESKPYKSFFSCSKRLS